MDTGPVDESHPREQPGFIAGRPLDEWNDAYARVESYLTALEVRNKLLLSRLVNRVLARATRRAADEPDKSPAELASEETDRLITEWFGHILQDDPTGTDQRISVRGRLALFLADMPGRWQDQFLQSGPWPGDFLRAMRESYFRAGPDFQVSRMSPRPIDLGPFTAFTSPGRRPYLLMILAWCAFLAALLAVFRLTHPAP